jgi:AcrR family transcriptional regulator
MNQLSLRERQRLEVRDGIREATVRLVTEQGFDAVSVGDIARAAGISQRTFYRYFPAKEDAIFSLLDDVAPTIHHHVRQHVAGDVPWRVLHDAFVATTAAGPTMEPSVMRMIYETPQLRALYFERQRRWEALLAEVLAERLGVSAHDDPRPALWSSITFNIVYQVNFENVVRDPRSDPIAHLEDRFRQAAEFFSGHLR